MDRAAWQATVHGVAKSQTRLSDRKTIHTELRVLNVEAEAPILWPPDVKR